MELIIKESEEFAIKKKSPGGSSYKSKVLRQSSRARVSNLIYLGVTGDRTWAMLGHIKYSTKKKKSFQVFQKSTTDSVFSVFITSNSSIQSRFLCIYKTDNQPHCNMSWARAMAAYTLSKKKSQGKRDNLAKSCIWKKKMLMQQ